MTQPTTITRQAAQAIENKLYGTIEPIAVFYSGGAPRCTKATTRLFERLVTETPGNLVGVYTAAVPIAVLEADLALMGIL